VHEDPPRRHCLSGLFFVKLDVLRNPLQTTSPGKDKESNWLPEPKGSVSLYIRSWPKENVVVILGGAAALTLTLKYPYFSANLAFFIT